MKTFVCQICGHIAFDQAPIDCPVCGAAIENFDNDPEVIKKPADLDNLTELETMHIPVIRVKRQCSLDASVECIDVHIKIGETMHVMESEHFINSIDLYVNKRYVTRVVLTHKMLYPASGFHLNISEGILTVIANCNVHGHWITKINLQEV